LALTCVLSTRALPANLFRHSSTGTIEEMTIGADGRTVESVRLRVDPGDDDLSSASYLPSPRPVGPSLAEQARADEDL
jgi:hypothetical protein